MLVIHHTLCCQRLRRLLENASTVARLWFFEIASAGGGDQEQRTERGGWDLSSVHRSYIGARHSGTFSVAHVELEHSFSKG